MGYWQDITNKIQELGGKELGGINWTWIKSDTEKQIIDIYNYLKGKGLRVSEHGKDGNGYSLRYHN
jgi:hypothetical protein